MKEKSATGCVFVFFLLIIVIFGTMDWTIGPRLWKQETAAHWPKTKAVVDSSRVFVDDSGDGVSYYPKIAYHYEFQGRKYGGDRVRYTFNFTSRVWAEEQIKVRPPGALIAVSVDPRNPYESVLMPGVDPTDWQAVLFLLPFNCIALAMLLSPWLTRTPPSGYPESRSRGRLYLHIQHRNPVGIGLLVAFGLSFGLIFVSAIVYRMRVGAEINQLEFALIGLGSLGAAMMAGRSNRELSRAVEVDSLSHSLSLPAVGRLNCQDIKKFALDHEIGHDSEGDEIHSYWLSVHLKAGRVERFHKASGQEVGERAIEWLNRKADVLSR